MIFNNFSELKRYVENANKSSMKELAEKEKKILQEEVQTQIYNSYSPSWYERTGDTYNNIQYTLGGNTIILKLEDTHSWYSVYNPSKKVYAFEMLEQGYTWGRPATNIKSSVISKVSKEIPIVYKNKMRSLGVPII